jgi:hypothetical protein
MLLFYSTHDASILYSLKRNRRDYCFVATPRIFHPLANISAARAYRETAQAHRDTHISAALHARAKAMHWLSYVLFAMQAASRTWGWGRKDRAALRRPAAAR